MTSKEKRKSMRLPLCRDVLVRLASWQTGVTTNVSRRGVYIRIASSAQLGQLVQLRIEIPYEERPLEMMAKVARRISPASAGEAGGFPGLGLEFFCLSSQVLQAWDGFIRRCIALLESHPRINGYDLNQLADEGVEPEASSDPVPIPMSDGQTREAERTNLIFRAGSLERLTRFAKEELEEGQLRLQIPYRMETDAPVNVLVIHPLTLEEFSLPGRVAAGADRSGLTIRFEPQTRRGVPAFLDFTRTGRLPGEAEVSL